MRDAATRSLYGRLRMNVLSQHHLHQHLHMLLVIIVAIQVGLGKTHIRLVLKLIHDMTRHVSRIEERAESGEALARFFSSPLDKLHTSPAIYHIATLAYMADCPS